MNRLFILFISSFVFYAFSLAQSHVSDILFGHGFESYKNGNFEDAIHYFELSHEHDYLDPEINDLRKVYNLSWIAHCYYKLGKLEDAQNYNIHDFNLEPIDRRLTRESDSLIVESQLAAEADNYSLAIDLIDKAISIEGKVLGRSSLSVANSLMNKAYYLNVYGNHELALEEINKSINILRSNKELSHSYVFGCALIKTALLQLYQGYKEQAQKNANEGVTIISEWSNISPGDLVDAYYVLVACITPDINYEKSKDYSFKLRDNLVLIDAEECIYYIDHLLLCSKALLSFELSEEAIKIFDIYLNNIYGEYGNCFTYWNILYKRGLLYKYLNNTDNAVKDILLSISGFESIENLDKNTLDENYLQLAYLYYSQYKYEQSIKAARESLQRAGNNAEDRSFQCVSAYLLLSDCYNALQRYAEALSVEEKAIDIMENNIT